MSTKSTSTKKHVPAVIRGRPVVGGKGKTISRPIIGSAAAKPPPKLVKTARSPSDKYLKETKGADVKKAAHAAEPEIDHDALREIAGRLRQAVAKKIVKTQPPVEPKQLPLPQGYASLAPRSLDEEPEVARAQFPRLLQLDWRHGAAGAEATLLDSIRYGELNTWGLSNKRPNTVNDWKSNYVVAMYLLAARIVEFRGQDPRLPAVPDLMPAKVDESNVSALAAYFRYRARGPFTPQEVATRAAVQAFQKDLTTPQPPQKQVPNPALRDLQVELRQVLSLPAIRANAKELTIEAVAEKHERLKELVTRVDVLQADLLADVADVANAAWLKSGGTLPFGQIRDDAVLKVGNEQRPKLLARLNKEFGDDPIEVQALVNDMTGFGTLSRAVDQMDLKPDLKLGETMSNTQSITDAAVPPAKAALINKLAKLGSVGDNSDLTLLKQTLGALHIDLLKQLADADYTIAVARNNIANGNSSVSGKKIGGFVADSAEGVHSTNGADHSISVRSMMRDGKLVLETNVLIHEIGHALDSVLMGTVKKPLNIEKAFADAFTEEHQSFTRTYFHTQPEFIAESFAFFALSPNEFKTKFPLTYAAFSALKLPKPLVDGQALGELNRGMIAQAPVTATPDASKQLAEVEAMNALRRNQKLPTEAIIFELDGEPAATRALAKQLGSELIALRAPQTAPYGHDDGFWEITADIAANPDALFNDLAGGKGAVLYVPDVATVGPTSVFMQRYREFASRHNGLVHLVVAGERDALKGLKSFMPTTMRRPIEISPLSENQIAELVRREVANDGYTLSDEALAALAARSKGGDYASAMKLWNSIKQTQFERQSALGDELKRQPNTVGYVLASDVKNAKTAAKTDAFGELDAMTGLSKVKSRIREVINTHALEKRRTELGLPGAGQLPRLNMVWPGNPGTGKTTVARLFTQIALEKGLIRRNAVQELGAADLMEGGAQAAMTKFKAGKGGVIFIDEFHQLDPKNNSKGKSIIDLLTPMLTDPEWADTVFVFAGYEDKIAELMAADAGLASRLEVVPFENYSKPELREIAVKEFKKSGITLAPDVLDAFMTRVDRKQRSTPYPGNARDVVKTAELVKSAQNSRLAKLQDVSTLTAKQLTSIQIDDVVVKPKYSVEEVMAEIDEKVVGNDDIKSVLWGVVGVVQRNQQLGFDPLKDVTTTFIIDGPAGSGKTTIAKLISKLFHALEILPTDDTVETTGGKMVGGFLGNSSALAAEQMVEKAMGKVLFIDELKSMITSGDFSEQSIKELMTQMIKRQGQIIFVGADYDFNIDAFLAFDSGLSSRFKQRMSTEKMTAENATGLLTRLAKARGWKLSAATTRLAQERMNALAALSQFASGRDVESLDSAIAVAQSKAYTAAVKEKKGASFDWSKIDSAMMGEAFDSFYQQVKLRPNPNRAASGNEQAVKFAVQTATQSATETQTEVAEDLSSEEHSFLATVDDVNKKFATLANTDPAEFARQEADPNSDYNKAIGAATGTTSAVAMETTKKLRVKVRKLVEVLVKKGVQKFSYKCPFCGRTDSMDCAYFSVSEAVNAKSFTYPRSWLIEHSLTKPWTETVFEKKKVEKIVEEERVAGTGNSAAYVNWDKPG